MSFPTRAVRDWILRTLQSTINLVDVVVLGGRILDPLYCLALENQIARLIWILNKARRQCDMEPRTRMRNEWDIRQDDEIADDIELPFSATILPLSDTHTELLTDET